TTPNPQRRSRVTIHPNARLTPAARRLLVHRVRSQGWLVKDAAEAAGVSRRTAHKWLKRFEEAGEAGLLDRSSRPLSSPRRIAARIVRAIARLRHRGKPAWEYRLRAAHGEVDGVPDPQPPGPGAAVARARGGGPAAALRARAARRPRAHRCEEARADRGDRPPDPRRSKPSLRGRGLGNRLRLRR